MTSQTSSSVIHYTGVEISQYGLFLFSFLPLHSPLMALGGSSRYTTFVTGTRGPSVWIVDSEGESRVPENKVWVVKSLRR